MFGTSGPKGPLPSSWWWCGGEGWDPNVLKCGFGAESALHFSCIPRKAVVVFTRYV
jgi:hypothetical protein